jgi:hypothetical protein
MLLVPGPLDALERQPGEEDRSMPRYLVERTFPEGLAIPVIAEGAATCLAVVSTNADDTVHHLGAFLRDPGQGHELLRL